MFFFQVGFAVLVDHRVKTKESKKLDKYLCIVRELDKLRNMIPIVLGVSDDTNHILEKLTESTFFKRKNHDYRDNSSWK